MDSFEERGDFSTCKLVQVACTSRGEEIYSEIVPTVIYNE